MVKYSPQHLLVGVAATLPSASHAFVAPSAREAARATELNAWPKFNFFGKKDEAAAGGAGVVAEEDYVVEAPSLAQTHMQGPLKSGSGGAALTREELDDVKIELEKIKAEGGFKEPVRDFMDTPGIKWRFGGAPDYSLANLLFLKGRSKIHPEGSLELIVENLVKTWEMERSHKVDHTQHECVDQSVFRVSANGGKKFTNAESTEAGNYNVLFDTTDPALYDAKNISWEESHEMFEKAFAAFPWEVLEVFSGPPKVSFSWRHWGDFTGEYEGNKGKGELVEMYGFGTATVNDELKLQEIEIFYNAEEFIKVLKGDMGTDAAYGNWQAEHGCPFSGGGSVKP